MASELGDGVGVDADCSVLVIQKLRQGRLADVHLAPSISRKLVGFLPLEPGQSLPAPAPQSP